MKLAEDQERARLMVVLHKSQETDLLEFSMIWEKRPENPRVYSLDLVLSW